MKTLGVYLSPDSNNDVAVAKMKEAAFVWGDNIWRSHLDRKVAWKATESTICKSLQYPLPAITWNRKQWKKYNGASFCYKPPEI